LLRNFLLEKCFIPYEQQKIVIVEYVNYLKYIRGQNRPNQQE